MSNEKKSTEFIYEPPQMTLLGKVEDLILACMSGEAQVGPSCIPCVVISGSKDPTSYGCP